MGNMNCYTAVLSVRELTFPGAALSLYWLKSADPPARPSPREKGQTSNDVLKSACVPRTCTLFFLFPPSTKNLLDFTSRTANKHKGESIIAIKYHYSSSEPFCEIEMLHRFRS